MSLYLHSKSKFRHHDTKSGFGTLLILVLALLLCLAIIGIGQGYFSSFVSDQTHKNLMGDIAYELAENAIESAHFIIGQSANNPSGEENLYLLFRENTDDFSVDLKLSVLPGIKDELGKKGLENFSIIDDCVNLEVLFQHPMSVRNPTEHDRYGTMRLTARSQYEPKGVVRTVTKTYDFKLTSITTPRPFDLNTMFIHEPSPYLSYFAYKGDPNLYIDLANQKIANYEKATRDLKKSYEDFVKKIKGKPKSGPVVKLFEGLIAEMNVLLEQDWPPKVTISDSNKTRDKENTVHRFPKADTFALWTNSEKIDFGLINIAPRLEKRQERLAVIEPEHLKVNNDIKEFLDSTPTKFEPLVPMQQEWNALVKEIVWLYYGVLIKDYKAFQDSFYELGEPTLTKFKPFIESISMDEMAARCSTYLAEGDASIIGDGRTLNDKFKELLARNEAHNGILYIHNPTEELVINHTFKGRLVIIVRDDVNIQQAAVADPEQDLLTIACFGRMAIEGKAQASLIVGGTLSTEPEADIVGNMFIQKPDLVSVRPERLLTGTLQRDERLVGGPARVSRKREGIFADYQYFTLGPEPIFVSSERR